MSGTVDYEATFRCAPSAMAVLSPDFTYAAVNDNYELLSGRSRADLVGQNVFTAFPDDPEGARMLRRSLDRVLASGERDRMPLQRYDVSVADDPSVVERRYWSIVNTPVLDEDGTVARILHRVEEATEVYGDLPAEDAEQAASQVSLYAHSRELHRANQSLAAAADIRHAVLTDLAPGKLFSLVAAHTLTIADADSVVVLVPDATGRWLTGVAAAGAWVSTYENLRLALQSDDGRIEPLSVRAYHDGHAVVSADAGPIARQTGLPEEVAVGAAVAVPVGHGDAVRAVLGLVYRPDRPVAATLPLLENFAAQVDLALELADRRTDATRFALLDERERIARRFNTAAVKRLFAISLDLTATATVLKDATARRRMQQAVAAIDDLVRWLTEAVFTEVTVVREPSVVGRIQELADGAAEVLGAAVTYRIDHRLNTAAEPVKDLLLTRLRSALSVVGTHAGVTDLVVHADLEPEAAPQDVIVTVQHDGVPPAAPGPLADGITESVVAGHPVFTWRQQLG